MPKPATTVLECLEKLPNKRLVRGEYISRTGECCTMGAVYKAFDLANLDLILSEGRSGLGVRTNIKLSEFENLIIQENDFGSVGETPEARYVRMVKFLRENETQLNTEYGES